MLVTVVKVIVSALIVALVTTISKQYPGIGGWIAALPIISILSAAWLAVGHQSSEDVSRFLIGVLKGLVPTAMLLIAMVMFLRRGWTFPGALGLAIVIWGVSSFLLERAWS
ncbi:MAG: DUF3147 family protein, partial [Alicyclobacillus sp.]|nr:DUF3147 family protein [Alicyclobacillus sp.]